MESLYIYNAQTTSDGCQNLFMTFIDSSLKSHSHANFKLEAESSLGAQADHSLAQTTAQVELQRQTV